MELDRAHIRGVAIGAGAALLAVIGCVTSWVSAGTPVGSIGITGTSLHMSAAHVSAWYIFAGAIVVGAGLLLSLTSGGWRLPVLVSLLVAVPVVVVTGFDFIQIARGVYDASGIFSVSIGIGLWLTLVASVGMLVGSIMTMPGVQTVDRPRSRPATGWTSLSPAEPEQKTYWAHDPFGRHEKRWWDGNRFTDRVMDGDVEGSDPPGQRKEAPSSST